MRERRAVVKADRASPMVRKVDRGSLTVLFDEFITLSRVEAGVVRCSTALVFARHHSAFTRDGSSKLRRTLAA